MDFKKIDDLTGIINEIDRMIKIYRKVEDNDAKKVYSQYVDLVIEQTDFNFNEKSNLREYYRRSVKK